ncbi:hypothetical protein SLE2022_221970 [Rubroshorea leprosula]
MTQKKHQHNDRGRRRRLMGPLMENLQEEPTANVKGVQALITTHCDARTQKKHGARLLIDKFCKGSPLLSLKVSKCQALHMLLCKDAEEAWCTPFNREIMQGEPAAAMVEGL